MVVKIHVQVLVPRDPDIYVLVRYLLSSTTITYIKKLENCNLRRCVWCPQIALEWKEIEESEKMVHLERIAYIDISDVFHF